MAEILRSVVRWYQRQIMRLPQVPASSYGVMGSLRNSLPTFLPRTDPRRSHSTRQLDVIA